MQLLQWYQLVCHSKKWSKHQSVGWSVSQSISQPASQSASQPVSQPASQPASQPVIWSANQSVSQSSSEWVSQSVSELVRALIRLLYKCDRQEEKPSDECSDLRFTDFCTIGTCSGHVGCSNMKLLRSGYGEFKYFPDCTFYSFLLAQHRNKWERLTCSCDGDIHQPWSYCRHGGSWLGKTRTGTGRFYQV